MKKLLLFVGLFLMSSFFVNAQAILDGIVFNEILADPNDTGGFNFDTDGDGAAETSDEFIELYNTTGAAIDVSNWETWDGSTSFSIPVGTSIAANGYLVLVAAYAPNTPPANFIVKGGSLGNGGDDIFLYNPTTDFYIGMEYNSSTLDDSALLAAHPTATSLGDDDFGNDVDGQSIQRIPDGTTTFSTETPTPGLSNGATVTCSITSVFVNNAACDVNGDFNYDVNFTANNGSGSYDVVDNATSTILATGASSPITLTLAGNTSTTSIVLYIQDTNDVTCASTTTSVTPVDCSLMTVCVGAGDLVITEFIKNPSAVSDTQGEWFEVYNTTGADIDMFGFELSDNGSESTTVTASVIVPANAYAVLGINGDMATNGGVSVDYDYGSFNLSNSDDEIIISCGGVVIDSVYYDSGTTYPNLIGISASLDPSILDAMGNDTGANWCASTTAYGSGDLGTPGQANDACPVPCAITGLTVSNEVCTGTDFTYEVSFTAMGDSGSYDVVDNASGTILATGTASPMMLTIAGNMGTTPFDIYVQDTNDTGCASTTATVTPVDCSSPLCPTDLVLTPTETGSMTYQVSNNITSTDVIIATEVVVYDAGVDIDLNPDFEVILGAEFDAIIGGCTPFAGESADNE